LSSVAAPVASELQLDAVRLRGSSILGLGTALPARVVDNAVTAERLGVDPHWIVKRVGVERRHVMSEGERVSDLGALAARRALADAGVDPADIDIVVAATATQDELMPNTGPLIASAIGATGAGAFDVGAACNGFLSALSIGASQIESGRVRYALVVGVDALSRFIDPDDRRTAPLFGDGAGAVVLGGSETRRVAQCVLRSDAAVGAPLVYLTRSRPFLHMEGEETYRFAVRALREVTLEILELADLTIDDVDLFVYHQANARILGTVSQQLGLDPARVVDCVAGTGNTTAASLPLALASAADDGRLEPGRRVLMAAIGAGFAWGAALIEWGADT
jgi:3-oxoacyl-[acyl-carrier-protein] synthase-3